ncbi:MAG: alpha/beta fold hydrolase [Hyphomicrobiales bacterium]
MFAELPKGPRLYYEVAGEGPPLLFVSGLGGNHTAWTLTVPQFAKRWQCITFDNRGTGESDVPPGPYTIEEMADDAAALLEVLGIEGAACVGVSLGASVLQAMAYRHPARIARLVLISAFPSYTEVQHRWLDAHIALRKAGLDPLSSFVAQSPWTFTAKTLGDHDGLIRLARLLLEQPNRTTDEGFFAQAAAIRNFDSRPNLPRVTAPTLVLTGAEDVLTPIAQAVEIAELIPNAHLQVLPRGGHGMVGEYHDDVMRAVRAFLDRQVPFR